MRTFPRLAQDEPTRWTQVTVLHTRTINVEYKALLVKVVAAFGVNSRFGHRMGTISLRHTVHSSEPLGIIAVGLQNFSVGTGSPDG